jgi:5,10-methylenetetrahydrofolate reductase
LKSQEQALKTAQRFGVSMPQRHLARLPKTDADAAAAPHAAVEAFLSLSSELRKHGAPGIHVFVLSDNAAAIQAISKCVS